MSHLTQPLSHEIFFSATVGNNVYMLIWKSRGRIPNSLASAQEWANALEACGIDVHEVGHHTEAWEVVIDEPEDNYSIDE